MGEGMRVSLIVAVRDGERHLAEALGSALAQTRPPDEIVVVDGGSRDRSREIAAAHARTRVVAQRGVGLAAAWNTGIEAARGDALALLDGDDRWPPDKLACQLEALDRHPPWDAVIGRVRFFLEPGARPPATFRRELLEGTHPGRIPGALLARRRAFERVGGFDPGLRIAADVDWFARAKDAGLAIGVLDALCLEKRVHGENLSHDARTNDRELLRLLRASIARQRGPAAGG